MPSELLQRPRAGNRRRAATVDRLAAAAVDEIRSEGYDGLTVRNVARRAGVAPATAYTHFTSKDHLVAEVFWRLLEALPAVVDPDDPRVASDGARTEGRRGRNRERLSLAEQVAGAIADVAGLVADEPAIAAAATTAMFANEPEVARLRRRIGTSFRQRFAAALGDDADEAAVDTLDLAFSGALVRCGVGELAYADLVPRMAQVAEVVTRRS